MSAWWKSLAAGVMAMPYRLRLAGVGRRPRMFPPLLINGGQRIRLGDDVRIEAFAALSSASEGRIVIGSRCELHSFSRLDADVGVIELGDGCSVNAFSVLNGFGGLTIGSNVRIASHCVILSSSHRHEDAGIPIHAQGISAQGTTIGDDVWLGAHCVVVGGVHIGSHSVIGAGAVVLDDVPEYSVAAGVPARVIRQRAG